MAEVFHNSAIWFVLAAIVVLFLAGVYRNLTRPGSFEDMMIPRDRAEMDRAVKEMVHEMEVARSLNLPKPDEASKEPFWGVDCRYTQSYGVDKFRFILVKVNEDGKIEPAGDAVVSDIAPADEVSLLGDYGEVQDWLILFGDQFKRAIERRKNRPTVWDHVKEEAS